MAGLVGLAPATQRRWRGKAATYLMVLLCVFALCAGIDGVRKPAFARLLVPVDSFEVTFVFASPPNAAFISFTDGVFSNALPASPNSVTDPRFQGHIRFTPEFPGGAGFIDFELENFNVRAGHSDAMGVLLHQDDATIATVSVSPDRAIPTTESPTPAALFLFFSGLLVLGCVVLLRRGKDGTGPT